MQNIIVLKHLAEILQYASEAGSRSYHEVKHRIKKSWFDPFKENGDRLHIIGIQAFGDKKFEETRDENTFLPINFDALYLQPEQDPETFVDSYDREIYQSCTPYPKLRGLVASLEGIQLSFRDYLHCANIVESIEAKRGGINFTHIFLLRWDIYPFRKVPTESLKTIDSTLIVPIQTATGIDDQLVIGPRRYMMKFLRGVGSSWNQLLKEKKCEIRY